MMSTMSVQKYYGIQNVVLNVVLKWDTLCYQFSKFEKKKKMEVYTMTCLNDYEMIIRMNVERRRNDALAKKRGKKKWKIR